MADPNIGTGVLERTKPQRTRKNLCWRFEGVLNAGSSIFTPVFDCVADGRPLSETEVAGTAGSGVVIVSSRYFIISVLSTSDSAGGRLQVFSIADNGAQDGPYTLWVPFRSGGGANPYGYNLIGRRCQFRLQNSPIGVTAGTNQTYKFEIVNEG